MLPVSVSAYKQAGAERKSDPIFRKVGGGGTCMRPGMGSNNGRVYDCYAPSREEAQHEKTNTN